MAAERYIAFTTPGCSAISLTGAHPAHLQHLENIDRIGRIDRLRADQCNCRYVPASNPG